MTTPARRHQRGGCGLPPGAGPRRGHVIRRTRRPGPGRGVRAGGIHRGAAAMAQIEQNGHYSPPPGTPKTTQDHARRLHPSAFPVIRAIAGDRPDNAGMTPRNQGPGSGHRTFQGVAGGDLQASGTTAAPPGRLRSEPGQQADHPFPVFRVSQRGMPRRRPPHIPDIACRATLRCDRSPRTHADRRREVPDDREFPARHLQSG